VYAGYRVSYEITITKENGEPNVHLETLTFDDTRFRIDFLDAEGKKTEQSPYIMTADNGGTWYIGDKPDKKFYCSHMKTNEFFESVGEQATGAMKFFNVKAEKPVITKVFEKPVDDIHGFKTTHLQLETHASAYAWILFLKFEYKVKIVDDIFYTSELEVHPTRKKWLEALTQSGNDLIDNMYSDYTSKVPGPVIQKETVIEITDLRKNKVKTEKRKAVVTKIEEISAEETDAAFITPECIPMDDDEVQEKAKALFSANKLMLGL
jgi:hypothetical protein